MGLSRAQMFARLPKAKQEQWLNDYANKFGPDAVRDLKYDWSFWGRPEQQLPTHMPWRVWLILAGRGWGKTKTGAAGCVIPWAKSGKFGRIHCVAPTASDARDIMVEGESGIMASAPPSFYPEYEPSKRKITFPNGVVVYTFSAEEPDRLRGPQCHKAWCDEPASWPGWDDPYNAWTQLWLGLRLGDEPQAVLTTTPRPLDFLRELVRESMSYEPGQKRPGVVVTKGSTFDNADNLAEEYIHFIRDQFEGTRQGRQELYAEILDDMPGALWNRQMLDNARIRNYKLNNGVLHYVDKTGLFRKVDLKRVAVGVDPAITSGETSDETGIVVVASGADGKGYVLADYSLKGTPDEWGKQVVKAYREFNADVIIAETNNGGDMIEHTVRTVDRNANVKQVRASRGKVKRAEPVAALYEQQKIHHLGMFEELEDQMTRYSTDPEVMKGIKSPDRGDALVWGLTHVMLLKRDKVPFQKVKYI